MVVFFFLWSWVNTCMVRPDIWCGVFRGTVFFYCMVAYVRAYATLDDSTNKIPRKAKVNCACISSDVDSLSWIFHRAGREPSRRWVRKPGESYHEAGHRMILIAWNSQTLKLSIYVNKTNSVIISARW